MANIYRKPKNAEEAVELCKSSNVEPEWSFVHPTDTVNNQKYFSMYEPILFIYKNEKLVAAAHNKLGSVQVYNIDDQDITNTFSKDVLNDMDMNLKQIELF